MSRGRRRRKPGEPQRPNVRLPNELYDRMKARASLHGRTIQDYVSEAIRERVESDEEEDGRAGRS